MTPKNAKINNISFIIFGRLDHKSTRAWCQHFMHKFKIYDIICTPKNETKTSNLRFTRSLVFAQHFDVGMWRDVDRYGFVLDVG